MRLLLGRMIHSLPQGPNQSYLSKACSAPPTNLPSIFMATIPSFVCLAIRPASSPLPHRNCHIPSSIQLTNRANSHLGGSVDGHRGLQLNAGRFTPSKSQSSFRMQLKFHLFQKKAAPSSVSVLPTTLHVFRHLGSPPPSPSAL